MASARKPRLPRLSPTKLNSYLTCPRQYYYGYVRKAPRRARSYFSFGSSLHSALQTFHEKGGAPAQEVGSLLDQLQTSWVSAGYASPEEQAARFDAGQQILNSYYTAETQRHAEGPAAETLFLEKTLSVPGDGFVLTGRIDRIDRRLDGLLEVVDYKSGNYLPTVEELEDDLAIAIYQVLVFRNLEAERVVGTIYNLRRNESVSISRNRPELEKVEKDVTEAFQVLSSDTTFAPVPGTQCFSCDFASYCPYAVRPAAG